VLGVISRRHAELLLLRSDGLSYEEVASTLDLNPSSIGTLLSRAQQGSEGSTSSDMENNNNADIDRWMVERLATIYHRA
jgi:hypothetical protein